MRRPFRPLVRMIDTEQRLRNLPQPTYPDDLPVVARREDIARAISANQVVITDAATFNGRIDMDQRTIAARVAKYKAEHVKV